MLARTLRIGKTITVDTVTISMIERLTSGEASIKLNINDLDIVLCVRNYNRIEIGPITIIVSEIKNNSCRIAIDADRKYVISHD